MLLLVLLLLALPELILLPMLHYYCCILLVVLVLRDAAVVALGAGGVYSAVMTLALQYCWHCAATISIPAAATACVYLHKPRSLCTLDTANTSCTAAFCFCNCVA
jgi:hypothetical protein